MASHFEAAAPTRANPGETLRASREQKNWTLAAVAQQLNLSERSLAQIEAGDFSQLPGHTFARGYVRAYAKLLGLDQNRLVQEFDLHTGTDASGASVNSLGRIEEPGRLSHNIMRFFTFALLLIVAGAAFYWWQDQRAGEASGPSVTALERIEVEAADGTTEIHLLDRAEDPDALQDETITDETLPGESELPEQATPDSVTEQVPGDEQPAAQGGDTQVAPVTPQSPAVTGESASQPAPAPTEPTAATQTPAAPAAPAASAVTGEQAATAVPAGEGRLELQFSADCWTKVTDANGKVLFSGMGKAGTFRTVTGKPPLDLHLGFASGVQVSYNGKAVSLAGNTRGETARLKLGQ